ncbi:hypothetical protein PAQ31011_00975 [Pandoraea aquatica]|uniref:Uncharacterized protein n=1 Tax=Pandoraea aquatica TaxID=2508290 RepID=A0A5E4SU09_9BURK|nr:hypothetical protein PAQ31011_00975 [Pandoraea aquatica]
MTRPPLARPRAPSPDAAAHHRAHALSSPASASASVSHISGAVDAQALAHAYALYASNDLEGAARAFAAICRALPDHTAAYKAFGYVLCQLGDYEQAIAPLMVAISREYGNPEPLYFAAICMQRTGDAQTAREMATDALDMARCAHDNTDLRARLTRLLDAL